MAVIQVPDHVLPLVVVSKDNETDKQKGIEIVKDACHSMPISRAMICDADGITTRPADSLSHDLRLQHYSETIARALASGSEMVHTGDWSVVAIWERSSMDPSERKDAAPLAKKWFEVTRQAKEKYLANPDAKSSAKVRPFYHLDYIARNPKIASVKGAVSAAILPFLERARQEGIPAWLEAATPYSARIYEYYGFRVVEQVTVGVGQYDAEGWPREGGEGLTLWFMIYDAHLNGAS